MSSIVVSGDTSGAITIAAPAVSGTNTLTLPAATGTLALTNTFGFKNRFINGAMQIAQRNTTGTSGSGLPTTTATYPSVDRWFAYGTGATVTVAQVAGSGNNKNNIQLTGAGSVTAAGIGQRIEAINCYDMAGQTVTLSANISNSLLTTVTWTAYYAGSADTWTSSTQIATGSWTVTSTLTQYSAQISIPSAATTGLQIVFSVGAQTSGTLIIGQAQLELGSAVTSFDTRDFGRELIMCQRYYQKSYDIGTVPGTSVASSSIELTMQLFPISDGNGGVMGCSVTLPVALRATGTLAYWDAGGNASKITSIGSGGSPTNNVSANATYFGTNKLFVRGYNISANGFSFGWTMSAEL